MKLKPAAFAIPGDMTQKTGGYIYEYELLMALRAQGRQVEHLQLPAGFPDPRPLDTEMALDAMTGVAADVPLIIDGLVFGSIDTMGLARVEAPIIAMIHHPLGLETGLPVDLSLELRRREADNLRLARAVIVPSPHTARILVQQFGVAEERITIALPGFRPADAVHTPRMPPLILSVGLLAERKGHDIFIAALGKLRHLEWQAEIVGKTHDTRTEVHLREQIRMLGLEQRISLAGLLSDAEVIDRYRSASIFALATRYEGYGIVLGEAMLHGLPIVSCQTGAVPDTVPNGAGILVPVDDTKAFAQALQAMLLDHGLRDRIAQTSAEAGRQLPSWSTTAKLVGAVLDNATEL